MSEIWGHVQTSHVQNVFWLHGFYGVLGKRFSVIPGCGCDSDGTAAPGTQQRPHALGHLAILVFPRLECGGNRTKLALFPVMPLQNNPRQDTNFTHRLVMSSYAEMNAINPQRGLVYERKPVKLLLLWTLILGW